jgi:hypothetical protein
MLVFRTPAKRTNFHALTQFWRSHYFSRTGGREAYSHRAVVFRHPNDNLPRLREWFGAFYHKPEMADQVAVWGSAQHITDEIIRGKKPA